MKHTHIIAKLRYRFLTRFQNTSEQSLAATMNTVVTQKRDQ